MAMIFLSYRRQDSDQVTIRLYQWLIHHGVPRESIFFDTRAIRPGTRFPDEIRNAVRDARVVLAIMGTGWEGQKRGWLRKQARIFESQDWVRQEISLALDAKRPIIPILLGGMRMPAADHLPVNVRPLPECQSVTLRVDEVGFDEDVIHVAEALRRYTPDLFFDGQTFTDLAGARKTYLNTMAHRYHDVSLPISADAPLPLTQIYQPLELRRDPPIAARLERGERRALVGERVRDRNDPRYFPDREQVRRRLEEQGLRRTQVVTAESGSEALSLSASRRIVVLGGPGTGKTTLLHRFVIDAAQAAQSDPTLPVPVNISLAELARSGEWTKEEFPNFLKRRLQQLDVPSSYAETLAQSIDRGNALLCLDGLDEVKPSLRPAIIDWINNLSAPVGQAAIVVGSRFTDYKGKELSSSQYAEWELKPLDHETRERLAAALIPLLARALGAANGKAALEPAQFVAALETHPQAAGWSEIPLLFTLAAFVAVRRGTLPDRRVDLYHDVVDAIVSNREKLSTDFSTQDTRDVLAALALDLFLMRGRTFTEEDLRTALRPICREFNIVNEGMLKMYDRIIGSGILDPVASNTYGFRHLTFQEYLASAALAYRLAKASPVQRAQTWALIQEKRTRGRWNQVLRLMVGVLFSEYGREGREAARQWIAELSGLHATPDGDPGYISLTLAVQSLDETPAEAGRELAETAKLALTTWVQALVRAALQDRPALLQRLIALGRDVRSLPGTLAAVGIDTLLRGLQDESWRVRVATAQTLGQMGGPAALDGLRRAAHDGDGDVQRAAVQALGRLGERDTREALLALIESGDDQLRAAAVQALGQLGELAPRDALVRVASDADPSIRAAALGALGRLGRLAPLDVLRRGAVDSDAGVRAAAVRALGQLGERAPVDVLLSAAETELGDTDPDVLLRRPEDARVAAIQALGQLGERVPVEALLRLAENAASRGRIRERAAAIEALVQLGERAPVDGLLRLAEDPDEGVRAAAIEALGQLGERAPVDVLLRILRSSASDSRDRSAAIRALVQLGERAPLDVLLSAAETEPGDTDLDRLLSTPEDVRVAAIQALGQLGERVPVEALLRIAHDPSRQVRIAVIQALGQVGERIPLDALLRVVSSTDPDVRKAAFDAAEADWNMTADTYASALLRTDHDVAQAAQVGASSLPLDALPREVSDPIRLDAVAESEASRRLEQPVDHISVEALLRALDDEDLLVRVAAVRALGQLGDQAPLDRLLAAADDRTSDIRAAAMEAFGYLGDRVPIEALVRGLGDESAWVRAAAAKASVQRGSLAPIDALVLALGDTSSSVRTAAGAALREVAPERLPGVVDEGRRLLSGLTASVDSFPIIRALIEGGAADLIGEAGIFSSGYVAYLNTLLNRPYWAVRMRSARALGRIRRGVPDTTLLRLYELRRDPSSRAASQASDDALAEILSVDPIEDDD